MLRIDPRLLDPSCLSSDEEEVRIPQKRGSYVRQSLIIPKLTREDIKVAPRGSNRLRRSHHLVNFVQALSISECICGVHLSKSDFFGALRCNI